jgi:hypothetical protein
MIQSTAITADLGEIEAMIRKVIQEEIAKPNDILLTAKQAKGILCIVNHQSFHRLVEAHGVKAVSTGKSVRYSKKEIEEIVNKRRA